MRLALVAACALAAAAAASEPLEIGFTPGAYIRDFRGDSAAFAWNITASYTSSLSDASGWPGDPEDAPLHIPVLYFPSPGTTTQGVAGHPCVIRPPTGCCLLDFAEQYTSVAFYEYVQAQASWLNRTTCEGIEDLRPFVRGLYESGLAPQMVTGALRGFHGAAVETHPSDEAGGPGFTDVHAVVPHPVMHAVMASDHDGNATVVEGTSGELITFVGIMWLRTHPTGGGLLNRGNSTPTPS
jgi:hypothetical protein